MTPFFVVGLLLFFLKSVKGTLILSLVAVGIVAFFQMKRPNDVKTILNSETFMRHDEDVLNCLTMLKHSNNYRTDINDDVEKNMRLFFSTYFDLFYEWNEYTYKKLLDIERTLVTLVLSLEFERNEINYRDTLRLMKKVLLKYKTILSNKYDFEIDAPKPRDILNQ